MHIKTTRDLDNLSLRCHSHTVLCLES